MESEEAVKVEGDRLEKLAEEESKVARDMAASASSTSGVQLEADARQ